MYMQSDLSIGILYAYGFELFINALDCVYDLICEHQKNLRIMSLTEWKDFVLIRGVR